MKRAALFYILFQTAILCSAPSTTATACRRGGDGLPAEIRRELTSGETGRLSYPLSVKRFYTNHSFQPAWIKPQNGEGPAWQAMMLFDCLEQYGLPADDYHPDYLTYDRAHTLLDTLGRVSLREQARFELMLTDAVLTLINNLHYGKLNPDHPAAERDGGIVETFDAALALEKGLQQKGYYAFYNAVEQVQPRSKAYRDLQYHLRLLTGVYSGDNYESPDSEIHSMAVNLERLRWLGDSDSSFLEINIPAYTLRFHQTDTIYEFRVAVGTPVNPTPVLNARLTYFTIAPDLQVLPELFRDTILPKALRDPSYLEDHHLAIYTKRGEYIASRDQSTLTQIAVHPGGYFARHASGCDKALGDMVFQFPNKFGISMHDLRKKGVFDSAERASSSGCIWLEQAQQLADLLLMREGRQTDIKPMHKAIRKYQRQTYVLTKPLPVEVTYLTCEMREGELIIYKDIYNRDKSLEAVLFPVRQNLAMSKH